ncbi:hypothetical protein C2I27_04015 [Priestia megaterium]|uniref:hypothetical protein n=1 Tax=Priestia megaterium TaxID=1404 RepID=UPI000D5207BE|nr:hypothetical protein [Priestia megaterium]PVC75061.1 hypothetical protein C2I27_04015 [Priestia megaterium]
MNNVLNKLFAMLPEGKKKQELIAKYEKVQTRSKERGGDGLQDSFEFMPKGHIKIEAINESGDVVGTLADQPNLVVHGAEEILLRAFSGDPNRILYKNRVPKTSPTSKFYIDESKLAGAALFDGSQLLHSPNIIWSAIKDSDFEVSYGYFPVTVYIKEEVSTEFGKKAFSLSKTPATGYVPLNAEVYSTYTNLFIGIGEGVHKPIPLTDSRLTFSNSFTVTAEAASTTTANDEVKFKQKISNFAFEYEASNKGAQIDVVVNGVVKETIEAFDSELTEPQVKSIEYTGFDNSVETEIKLVHSGSDAAVTNPIMKIVGIHFDALSKSDNGLIKEFKNHEVDFLTPTMFNTTPMAPYTIQLPNFPVLTGSLKIKYNDIEFTEAAQGAQLSDTTFKVDYVHGVVSFNRALTGVMISYSVTGEIYDTELATTMTAGTITVVVPTDTAVTNESVGTGDAVKTTFNLANKPNQGTLVVRVAGSTVTPATVDIVNGTFTLSTAPAVGQAVRADYVYVKNVNTNKAMNKYSTLYSIKENTLKILDQNGVALEKVENASDFGNGKYMLDNTDAKLIKIAQNDISGVAITKIEVVYKSDEKPGVPTNYTRAVIDKPKTINDYPWFELDKGSVRFVAEFPELKPAHNITIREMGLFDGPRAEDKIAGFRNYPVKAFSLVRVGETRKEVNTGIRITWTITLMNEEGNPFQGGR